MHTSLASMRRNVTSFVNARSVRNGVVARLRAARNSMVAGAKIAAFPRNVNASKYRID
jgi:hypothetical protein